MTDGFPAVDRHAITLVQRLGTCMATLFLAMITNAMFFRTADEQTLNSESITIGPQSPPHSKL